MRSTFPGDEGFPEGLSLADVQPWRHVPELELLGPEASRDGRLYFGQHLTRSRKTNTDRAGRVLSDVSRSVSRCLYARVAAAAGTWSVETDDLADAAVTVVTFRRPFDADLEQEPVRSAWGLGSHWLVTRELVLTAVSGDEHRVSVDFLGPPGTRPGDELTWVGTELYRLAL